MGGADPGLPDASSIGIHPAEASGEFCRVWQEPNPNAPDMRIKIGKTPIAGRTMINILSSRPDRTNSR
jgi:hypothetical protein